MVGYQSLWPRRLRRNILLRELSEPAGIHIASHRNVRKRWQGIAARPWILRLGCRHLQSFPNSGAVEDAVPRRILQCNESGELGPARFVGQFGRVWLDYQ